MKWSFRRAAAVVLAVALFVPTVGARPAQRQELSWDPVSVVRRVIVEVKRLLRPKTHGDVIGPPNPAPAQQNPTTTTTTTTP